MYKEGNKFCHRVLSVMEQKLFYQGKLLYKKIPTNLKKKKI